MRSELFALDRFTDDVVNTAYKEALDALSDKTSDERKAYADKQRNEALERGPLLNAACTYLVLAQADVTPEKLYHFSANAFRDLGLLQRAAECYFNSALVGYQQYTQNRSANAGFARRSAGRAKAMFSELGDDKNSDDSHILQQRIRFAELKRKKQWPLATVFWLWDRVSQFGTSASRWLASTLSVILLFAVAYPVLIRYGYFVAEEKIHRTGLALVTSSLAFSLGNLFQFGTLDTLVPATAVGQLVAITHGIVAFVLVGTGATFLTRR